MAMPQVLEIRKPEAMEVIPPDCCTVCGEPTTPDQHSVCQPCWENAIQSWRREHARAS